tara:strand:- start:5498 stop:5797 length:300 start_codon:yes stop_codon:yes gene_type:complete
MGSKKDVIKAPNDKIDNVIDTLDTLIALKKKIQCNEIIKPQNNNFNKMFLEIFNFFLKKGAKNNKKTEAINILCQTNLRESTEIKEPKIAVKPKTKTMK